MPGRPQAPGIGARADTAFPTRLVVVKTSPQQLSVSCLAATDGSPEPSRAESPQSPALSTTSTANCDSESSPVLPPLPAPTLPGRASELLRTPPNEPEEGRYVTASWGSPYPDNGHDQLDEEDFSSETSEESPIHQLDIHTPFLRTPPELTLGLAEQSDYAFVSASVLANRARRRNRGLTEDWIRQHTDSNLEEGRLWLSDGSGDDEPSSLSGSQRSDFGWLELHDVQTPRADSFGSRRASGRHPRTRSSVETLTPEALARMTGSPIPVRKMSNLDRELPPIPAEAEQHAPPSSAVSPDEVAAPPVPPKPATMPDQAAKVPAAPSKAKEANNQTYVPRPRKKVPWKGKNIFVLVPLDHERGEPGKPPMPLNAEEAEKMWRSWDELGYNTRGFDLNHDGSRDECETSQSRAFWPSHAQMAREHHDRKITVTLPDLNGKLKLTHVSQFVERTN